MRKAHQNYINKLLDIGDDVPGENTKRSITKRFLQYIKAKRKAQGGGVLPYMGHIGMRRCEGYGFQAVYSSIGYINQSVWV